ncbi:MAG: DNA cytosine methyltransferase [Verrucomicrobiota bacterium]|jgi:DNA (cytosine-5)-methyltransferase 1
MVNVGFYNEQPGLSGQAYARLHPQGIGFTITANFRNPGSGRFTHYRDNRSITVREAARLQSFDDRFISMVNRLLEF